MFLYLSSLSFLRGHGSCSMPSKLYRQVRRLGKNTELDEYSHITHTANPDMLLGSLSRLRPADMLKGLLLLQAVSSECLLFSMACMASTGWGQPALGMAVVSRPCQTGRPHHSRLHAMRPALCSCFRAETQLGPIALPNQPGPPVYLFGVEHLSSQVSFSPEDGNL